MSYDPTQDYSEAPHPLSDHCPVQDPSAKAPVTVQELNELAEKIKDKEEKLVEAKKVSTAIDAELDALYDIASEHLLNLGQKSFKTPFGTLQSSTRRSFKVPQGEGRELFFNKLKEMGVFESMITVNSATLNSFLKEEYIEAEKRGEDMVIYQFEGIERPTEKVITTLVKAR